MRADVAARFGQEEKRKWLMSELLTRKEGGNRGRGEEHMAECVEPTEGWWKGRMDAVGEGGKEEERGADHTGSRGNLD